MAGSRKVHEKFWNVSAVVLLIALIASLFVWAATYSGERWVAPIQEAVVESRQPTLAEEYRFSCQANTIISASYAACKNHQTCNLSNDEMMLMYVAGKTAVIDCKKAETLELFMGINDEIAILEQLKQGDPEDLFEPDAADQQGSSQLRTEL